MHKLGQGLTSIGGSRARAPRLLVWIAKRDHCAHQALLRDTEQRLRILPPIALEPANARTYTISPGGQHDALAQPPLVVGLLVNQSRITCHHQYHTQSSARHMSCVS